MDFDSSFAPHLGVPQDVVVTGQSGRQTTLPFLPTCPSVLLIRDAMQSKAAGPSSGLEDSGESLCLLAQTTRGVGKIADGGIQ